MNRFKIALTSLAMLAVCNLSVTAQNLFNNSSFEDPVVVTGTGPFTNWETFSLDADQDTGADVARNSTSMPRTGAQSLEVAIDNVGNSFAGVFQDVSVTAGDMVNYSGWHKSLLDGGGIEIRIEWRDSVNDVEISRTPNSTPMPGTEYELFSYDEVVPAGADTARAVYAIQSFGGVVNQQLFLDDFSFTAVPEPASLGLLGMGLCMLLGLRRRK